MKKKQFCVALSGIILALGWSLELGAQETSQAVDMFEQEESGINNFFLAEVGDTVTFGRYEQNNNLFDGSEPIEWIVLDKTESSALLISKYGLDVRQYHDDWNYNTWECCSLRSWLNEGFLDNAFDIDEQKLVMSVQNQNPDNPMYNTLGGNDTYDRVFTLNYQEAEQYFADDSERHLFITKYAEAQAKSQNKEGILYCWLRTGGNSNCQDAAVIDIDGNINLDGKCVDKYEIVRPVMCIDITGTGFSAYDSVNSTGEEIEAETAQPEQAREDSIDRQELTTYLYRPISEVNTYFDNLSEPVWVMGITSFGNEQVYFRSSDEESVTGIVLLACENPYFFNGIKTDMTLDAAGEILVQQGFAYLQSAVNRQDENYVYYDGDKTFINIWQGEDGYIGAEINDVGWGPHTDRPEAAFYMGKTMKQVMEEVDGLSVVIEDGEVILEKEGIRFTGEGESLSDTIVDGIYLNGADCRYSLYGIIPGDDWEEIRTDLGFLTTVEVANSLIRWDMYIMPRACAILPGLDK